MADSFAFATFFPNVLQPPVAIVCNTIFSILVKIRVCKKPVRKYDIGAASSSISISLPGKRNTFPAFFEDFFEKIFYLLGVESHDTERRRQIALKALSERLNQSEAATSSPTRSSAQQHDWPSLDEDEEEAIKATPGVHAPPPGQTKASTAGEDLAGAGVDLGTKDQGPGGGPETITDKTPLL